MTEAIVHNQISLTQTDNCKEIITDGIYTVCADTGEVIDYDYDMFLVTNTEGLEKESKADKLYSHYQHHYALLPNRGIGTLPTKFFERKQNYYTFAYRLSILITNSTQKALFTTIAEKVIANNKIRGKLYIIGAFAIKYCNVEFDSVIPIILNFTQDDEDNARQKLSNTIKNLNYILNHKLYLSEAEIKAKAEIRRKFIEEYKYNLLHKYGYLNLLDKFSKINNIYVIKIAVILLLLKDNRRKEAREVYEAFPKFDAKSKSEEKKKKKQRRKEAREVYEAFPKFDAKSKSEEKKKKKQQDYKIGFGRFIVEYTCRKERHVKKLTYNVLRTLVFKHPRVHSFKIRLTHSS